MARFHLWFLDVNTYNRFFFSGHIPKICFFTKVTVAVLFQLTFVSDEVLPPELSYNYTFGERTYTLYTNSFLNFGQVSYLYPLTLPLCITL
jgi:hypothetical protein